MKTVVETASEKKEHHEPHPDTRRGVPCRRILRTQDLRPLCSLHRTHPDGIDVLGFRAQRLSAFHPPAQDAYAGGGGHVLRSADEDGLHVANDLWDAGD